MRYAEMLKSPRRSRDKFTQEKAAKIWAVLAEKEPKNKIGENPC
jgi:hypothetical protein